MGVATWLIGNVASGTPPNGKQKRSASAAVSEHGSASQSVRADVGPAGVASVANAWYAAKIAVDFWRNVYALNYEVIPVQEGGAPGFTEPSVSLWVPSNSCTGANCST